MAAVTNLVEVEGPIREWARAHAGIAAAAPGGVFFGVPDGAVYPQVTLSRVGGAPDVYAPVDLAQVSFSCWGDTKADAAALAAAVTNAAQSFTAGTAMGADAVGLSARVVLVLFSPDPVSGRARYVVDVDFGVRAAG